MRPDAHARSRTGVPEPEWAGSRRVVVVGSSNQDVVVTVPSLPSPGQTVLGTGISLLPGGKGANQAVAAARAGAAVSFVTCVGDDDAGRRTVESLQVEGVNASAVQVHPTQPTGTAVVLVSADGENQIATVQGANAALDPEHVRRSLDELQLSPADICLVSFEIGDDAVNAAAVAARRRGALLLVNPAPARPLSEEVLRAQPLLLPNSSEAEAISGLCGVAGARRLHGLSGQPVIVTLGGDGVLIFDEGAARHVPAEPVDVLDSTGAGDTFAGVLAARLSSGADLQDAVQYAIVGAALSVTKAGAREGSPTEQQIMARLRVRELITDAE